MSGPSWEELLDRHTPEPGALCHCGDPAEWRPGPGWPGMCSPCDFAGHPTCECSL